MLLIGAILAVVNAGLSAGVLWISSNGQQNWISQSAPVIETYDDTQHRLIHVHPEKTDQTIDGFGGCFNERGWDVLTVLPEEKREAVLRDLFHPEEGCKFNICRMPIGASDYAMDWYSLDDSPGDLEMKQFSIERDRKYLIPYIKAAKRYRPDLRIWGSPWCPPAWMKKNGHYVCQGQQENSRLIGSPDIMKAYALYFSKYVKAYAGEGIPIYAVHVQNEPHACQVFPSCLWTGEQMRDFIRDYLAPRFRKDNLDTEIWFGTINHGHYPAYPGVILNDAETAPLISGVGFQWDGKWAIAETHRNHPDVRLMQTESECGDGSNDHDAGLYTYSLLKHYFESGANSYLYWNMVLDQTGYSTWGWTQNSLISVNRFSLDVRYNFEFFVMKHFSAFIHPGAVRVLTGGEDAYALAFRNPDGSLVVTLANPSFNPWETTIEFDRKMVRVALPAGSVNTVVIEP